MGLFKLLTFPVSGPVSGTRLLLDVLLREAERELYDEAAIRQQLSALQACRELGQLDDAEFEQEEERLLERLLEARAYHQQRQSDG